MLPPMGQTRVDLQHLLEDLRDAYPDAIEESILSEIVANALDSGATSVRVLTDPSERPRRVPVEQEGHAPLVHEVAARGTDPQREGGFLGRKKCGSGDQPEQREGGPRDESHQVLRRGEPMPVPGEWQEPSGAGLS